MYPFISIEAVNAQERVVPVVSDEVRYRVTGPGRVISVGNSDPSCQNPDKPASLNEGQRSAFNGLCSSDRATTEAIGTNSY